MKQKNRELKLIFGVILLTFTIFLIFPVAKLLMKSFVGEAGVTIQFYQDVLGGKNFLKALSNSFLVAGLSAVLTTCIGFLLAYSIHYTNIPSGLKKAIELAARLPMLLPTITYGFAIMYSFGKQGFLTRIFGRQLFEIYGMNGLLLGYVIYTLPISFMLIYNSMEYVDKKFMIVSRLMGDNAFATFKMTVLRPLLGTLGASFIQCFFLSFTDFGIPAAVGGEFQVVAGVLYSQMLGSVPNFNNGAVVAMIMLLPSILSICVLNYLERYNVRYNRISPIELKKSPVRDWFFGFVSCGLMVCVLSVFAVIFFIPFVKDWPYQLTFTLDNFKEVLGDANLLGVYQNSLMVAALTAVFGTLAAYGGALVTARSTVHPALKKIIDGTALVTNTIPGMVIGLAFLFAFSGTSLQNTFVLIIICNIIHFFSTPYLMMKNSLSKMNGSWETVASLMGDSWVKTIVRVVTPNAAQSLLEVFSYYFINAMVTISAVIFIAGARTMVITTKIKELQYYNKFNQIFVLSLLILGTNLVVKGIIRLAVMLQNREVKIMNFRTMKRVAAVCLVGIVGCSALFTGCGKNSDQIVIYSNADDEAIEAMENALDHNGYEGKYILQSFGTSELGGKILAEGTNLEADLVTMSTFYLDSAQEQNQMFADLTFDRNTLEEFPAFESPITAQEGAIIVNTELMKEHGLAMPVSIKDLAEPEYKDMISVTDITSSSTAWLLIQALVAEYGEEEAKTILTAIYKNAGPHIEESGSGPLKKVRAGEVAIGFGLRHQAVADKEAGLPIDFVDPLEGNFSLTESVAVINKGEKTNPLAMEMAECIIKNGREELLETYPIPLYEGEKADAANKSGNPKTFEEKLTVDLLKQHQELSESCK